MDGFSFGGFLTVVVLSRFASGLDRLNWWCERFSLCCHCWNRTAARMTAAEATRGFDVNYELSVVFWLLAKCERDKEEGNLSGELRWIRLDLVL